MNLFLFPLKFWLAVLGSGFGETNTIDTYGLRRNKKQEVMRRHPDWFDEDGNFTGER